MKAIFRIARFFPIVLFILSGAFFLNTPVNAQKIFQPEGFRLGVEFPDEFDSDVIYNPDQVGDMIFSKDRDELFKYPKYYASDLFETASGYVFLYAVSQKLIVEITPDNGLELLVEMLPTKGYEVTNTEIYVVEPEEIAKDKISPWPFGVSATLKTIDPENATSKILFKSYIMWRDEIYMLAANPIYVEGAEMHLHAVIYRFFESLKFQDQE